MVKKGSVDKISNVNTLFDQDTGNGLKAKGQTTWNGLFQSAFTQTRNTGGVSPDGTAYKMRLLDVLQAGGNTVSP
jgi:hypothetical protein